MNSYNNEGLRPSFESLTLARSSTLGTKLHERNQNSKRGDVLCLDVDGTCYIRTPQGIYIGPNRDTYSQIKEKNIPLVLSTGRPVWTIESDNDFIRSTGLLAPDAVMAGVGTLLYFRNTDGILVPDVDYFNHMRNQQVGFLSKDPDTLEFRKSLTAFDPITIAKKLVPIFQDFAHFGLSDLLIDPNDGVGNLRLVAQGMEYPTIHAMKESIYQQVTGLKLHLSEYDHTLPDFNGWIHIIPSQAGKDRAIRYLMSVLNLAEVTDLNVHIFGDSSLDIPMLAMGVSADDKFNVHQYPVANMAPTATAQLETVSSLQHSSNSPRKSNITFLNQVGPDAINTVVSTLS